MIIADKLFVTLIDDRQRNQQVFWSFLLDPGESIQLCYIANRRTILYAITPYNVRGDLFVKDITVGDESQLTEQIPLDAFSNHFALPKTRDAEPGDQIIIEVVRIKPPCLKPLIKTIG